MALDIICDKAESKDYWIFITDRIDLLPQIENRYYNSKITKGANTDFEIAHRPGAGISIATAHKRRMSFEQLRELMIPYMDNETIRDPHVKVSSCSGRICMRNREIRL